METLFADFFAQPLTQLILWSLLIVALAIGAFEAICEASNQLIFAGRVFRIWSIVMMFLIGWAVWIVALAISVRTVLTWGYRRWRARFTPTKADALPPASGVWIHGCSGDVDDFRDWLDRTGERS